MFGKKKLILSCLLFMLANTVYAQKSKPATPEIFTQEKPAFVISPDKALFTIKLKSNPTTGYIWFLRDSNATLIEPVKHEYQSPEDKKIVGAPEYELWTFKAKPAAFVVPQQTVIRFVYARPWEQLENSTQLYFKIATMPAPKNG